MYIAILKYFLTISYGQHTSLCFPKNTKWTRGSNGGNKNVCADTHNTRQCDKSFEKGKTIPVVTWWAGDIFGGLSEKDLRKKKYWP